MPVRPQSWWRRGESNSRLIGNYHASSVLQRQEKFAGLEAVVQGSDERLTLNLDPKQVTVDTSCTTTTTGSTGAADAAPSLVFSAPGKDGPEVIMSIESGKFYWKGKEVKDAHLIYERFNNWMTAAETPANIDALFLNELYLENTPEAVEGTGSLNNNGELNFNGRLVAVDCKSVMLPNSTFNDARESEEE